MELPLREILLSYNEQSPLAEANTIPASWYVDRTHRRDWSGESSSAGPGRWWRGSTNCSGPDSS